jgi:hypothetical protein
MSKRKRDAHGNIIFKFGDRLSYANKYYDVISGNTPEGNIRIRNNDTGNVYWISLAPDIKKLPPCKHKRQFINDRSQFVCYTCHRELGR